MHVLCVHVYMCGYVDVCMCVLYVYVYVGMPAGVCMCGGVLCAQGVKITMALTGC